MDRWGSKTRVTAHRHRLSTGVCVLAAGAALVLSACSSSGGKTSSTSAGAPQTATGGGSTSTGGAATGSTDSAVVDAKKLVHQLSKPPSSIGITTPLKSKPPTGKFLIFLRGNLEAYQSATDGYASAAAALGWKFKALTYDPSSATSANAVMEQAVQEHPDFIAISGVPMATYATALKQAMAAKIPLFDQASDNVAQGAKNGLYLVVDPPEFNVRSGKYFADWVIADSNGQGKAVQVNIPDFSSLKTQADSALQEIKKCSGCSMDTIDVSIQTYAQGAVAAPVVSYVQQHPDVQYIVMAIGQLTTGVRQALRSAGVGQNVKIISQLPQPSNMQALANGDEQMVMTGPNEEASWNSVDAMCRLLEGTSMNPSKALLPQWYMTKSNLPTPNVPPAGIPGFQDQFKQLWHLTS